MSRYYTTAHIAKIYGICIKTACKYCREGYFDQAKQIGKRWFVPKEVINGQNEGKEGKNDTKGT